MSGEEKTRNAPLFAVVILLSMLCAAGGYLLYTGWVPPQTAAESEPVILPETEPTAPLTTAAFTSLSLRTCLP